MIHKRLQKSGQTAAAWAVAVKLPTLARRQWQCRPCHLTTPSLTKWIKRTHRLFDQGKHMKRCWLVCQGIEINIKAVKYILTLDSTDFISAAVPVLHFWDDGRQLTLVHLCKTEPLLQHKADVLVPRFDLGGWPHLSCQTRALQVALQCRKAPCQGAIGVESNVEVQWFSVLKIDGQNKQLLWPNQSFRMTSPPKSIHVHQKISPKTYDMQQPDQPLLNGTTWSNLKTPSLVTFSPQGSWD